MNNEDPGKEKFDEWNRDPNNWFLGVFYFNPKDKRIFPPKRIPALGWTVNFANPYSVITLTAILVIISLLATRT